MIKGLRRKVEIFAELYNVFKIGRSFLNVESLTEHVSLTNPEPAIDEPVKAEPESVETIRKEPTIFDPNILKFICKSTRDIIQWLPFIVTTGLMGSKYVVKSVASFGYHAFSGIMGTARILSKSRYRYEKKLFCNF